MPQRLMTPFPGLVFALGLVVAPSIVGLMNTLPSVDLKPHYYEPHSRTTRHKRQDLPFIFVAWIM
ncbi:MAG: hypothetical protein AT712_04885 [Caldivirga sp. CIS_19]|nr:MAG: hypothetical protein AT712_04885 [Caldivirga sp. CIS_19]